MDDPNANPTTSTPTPPPGSVLPSPGWVPPQAAPTPPPSWAPAQPQRDDSGRWVGVITGAILLGVGLWFFADRTLGLEMPDISWQQFWPVILILIGAAILLGAFRRERR